MNGTISGPPAGVERVLARLRALPALAGLEAAFEEVRGVEMHERLDSLERGRFSPPELLAMGSSSGYRSLARPKPASGTGLLLRPPMHSRWRDVLAAAGLT